MDFTRNPLLDAGVSWFYLIKWKSHTRCSWIHPIISLVRKREKRQGSLRSCGEPPKWYLWFSFAEPTPMPLSLDSLSSLRSPHPHSYPFTLLAWVSLFLFWALLHTVSPESLPSIKAMDPILVLVKFSEKLDKLFRQWKWQCEAVPLSLQGDKAILQQTKNLN